MSAAHNPILSKKEFSFFDLFAPRPRPEPGIAIVLYRSNGETLTLMPGQHRLTAAELAWGQYKGFYKIDIAQRDFKFAVDLPCNNDAFFFRAEVLVVYQIADPAEIVRKQIKHVQAVLQPEIISRMRVMSRKYSATQSQEAERDINRYFKSGLKINGIFAKRIIANLALEAASREHIRTLEALKQQQEENILSLKIKKIKIEFYNELIKQGQWKILALHLAEHPNEVDIVAQRLMEMRLSELNHHRELLKSLFDEDLVEEFHIDKIRNRLLSVIESQIQGVQAQIQGVQQQKKLPSLETSSEDQKTLDKEKTTE